MSFLISGIDVSQWHDKIDWEEQKKNVDIKFALLRAGCGDTLSYPSQLDETFEYNYSECKRVHLPVGAYWYSYATTPGMARQEAKSCIAALENKHFEYPIYYCIEEFSIFSTGRTDDIIKTFCSELEISGRWVGIYTFNAALEKYISSDVSERYPIALWQKRCSHALPIIRL